MHDMKKIITLLFSFVSLTLGAQTESVLESVEKNNISLRTLRNQLEVQRMENKTDLTLDNPEVEFDNCWGKPGEVGMKRNLSVSQTLDFAKILGRQRAVANTKSNLLDLQYEISRREVLKQADVICVKLVNNKQMQAHFGALLADAEKVESYSKRMMDNGSGSSLEYNRALLARMQAMGQIKNLALERKNLLAELTQLNGGEALVFEDQQYANDVLENDFDTLFAVKSQNHPQFLLADEEVKVGEKSLSLAKAQNIPNLTAGYAGEWTLGEQFHGFTLSMPLPLWQQKNKVKHAAMAHQVAKANRQDVELQKRNELKTLYERAESLQSVWKSYQEILSSYKGNELLDKAFQAGHINVVDYISSRSSYYDIVKMVADAEYEYRISLLDLKWW